MPIKTEPHPGEMPDVKNDQTASHIPANDGMAADEPPSPPSKTDKSKRRGKRWLYVLVGLLLVIVFGGVGAWFGYQSGLEMRVEQEFNQVAMAAVTQFQLGIEDENAGRFEMARKRYEYVIQLDSNFPGAQDRLAGVMLHQAETAIPTIAPTITPIPVTPTPDMRGIEEKFSTGVGYMRASDWDNAIAMLELVRKEDINYRAADIDGMFYIALRFRGMQKISNGSLEPGIYDLTLSERFAPLDGTADSYRGWARYYLTGASFWEIDWGAVVEIFGEIYPSLPNLRDGSGWTAQERFRIASIKYGDQLAAAGNYCEARAYYIQALALAPDEQAAATATAVQLLCEPPVPTDTPPPLITETPTPGVTDTGPITTEPIPVDPSVTPETPNP
jgi:tetratricopeptide (TPR) repeat protein